VTYASTLLDHAPFSVGSAARWRALRALSVLFLTTLTAASAQVSVPLPFTPVPLTLQPLVVLLGAAVLGARLGSLSQLLYLGAGLMGLPVFAFSPDLPPGAARLLGPTAGYLLAFPLAAFVTGRLAERGLDRHYLTSVLAMGAGLATIYLGGVAYLTPSMGLAAALTSGLFPFLVADGVKVLVAASVLPLAWRVLGRR
jgi:biotin transport system substrate-specific component